TRRHCAITPIAHEEHKLKRNDDNAVANRDPVEDARRADLAYVSDSDPGIRRKRAGKGFFYTGPDGSRVSDPETPSRIRRLAIPPAWGDVWISPLAAGHIQATGRD